MLAKLSIVIHASVDPSHPKPRKSFKNLLIILISQMLWLQ